LEFVLLYRLGFSQKNITLKYNLRQSSQGQEEKQAWSILAIWSGKWR